MSFLLQFDKIFDVRAVFLQNFAKTSQKICQITACNVLKLMVVAMTLNFEVYNE